MEATAWIALVALAFTGTQAWTARRKLQFDLFTKRFETWDAFNNALNGRKDEIRQGAAAGDVSAAEDKCLKEMWRQKRLMAALYPPEVIRGIDTIEARLMDFLVRCVDAKDREAVPSPEAGQRAVARFNAFMEADRELWNAQGALMGLVHPYIQQYGWWELYAMPAMRWAHVRRRLAVRKLQLLLQRARPRKAP